MAKYFFNISTPAAFQAQFSEFVKLPGSLPLDYVKPAMLTAQKDHIKPLLGPAFYNELLHAATPTASQTEAIEAVQEPLAFLTAIGAMPMLNVKTGQGGITQNDTNNESPAQWWQIRDMKRELLKNANNAMARLLEYLDENAEEHPNYAGSDARKRNLANFCNSFDTARHYLPKVQNHYIFQQMRAAMSRADEDIIKPAIGPQLYTALKTIITSGTPIGIYAPLLPYLQRAELAFAFAEALTEAAITWTQEYGLHVALINEVETGRSANATTIQEREQLVRSHRAFAARAIDELKKELAANAATYTAYVAPVVPVKPYVLPTTETAIYPGIGLPPKT